MSKAVNELNALAAVQEAAADWCAQRIDGDLSAAQEAEFRAWLNADPRHAREYRAIESLWDGAADIANRPAIEELRTGLREDWPPATQANHSLGRRWVLAAGLAAVAVAAGWLAMNSPAPEPGYVTDRGEQREVMLDDGTAVELDADTEIEVAYGIDERRITLVSGQAHFDVRRNPDRPFIVVAGDSEIRAIGTSFQVYRRPGTVTVTLLEGRVAVTPVADTSGDAVEAAAPAWKRELTPGQQLTLAIAKPITPEVISVDVSRVTAWQRGMMDFEALTLPEVVAELNRYSDIPVLIADPSLNTMRISGVFAVGDTETLLLALETGFDIEVRHRAASGDIALYPSESR